MATLEDRPFSKNYSGLINQSVIAACIALVCITSHEYMKRKRRGRGRRNVDGLGSVETWQFGYLYQGRSWAKNPSPPQPRGWSLSWVPEVVKYPEAKLYELRGIDATLYIRFLRGCAWFTFLHTVTTVPILLPIHVHFSDGSVSPRSMTRASISSLVDTGTGKSLLWIHLVLLFWVTFTWMVNLIWICRGAFKYRAAKIQEAEERAASIAQEEKYSQYHPHPHPQYLFQDIPSLEYDKSNRGLRLRTIMVTNLPQSLRSEKELAEYFRYYLSRPIDKPSVGLTSSVQPGLFNKTAAFLLNRAKRIPELLPRTQTPATPIPSSVSAHQDTAVDNTPEIDRVVIARKMTELASLLERREDVLRKLETAHIKLARKVLNAVRTAIDEKEHGVSITKRASARISLSLMSLQPTRPSAEAPGPEGDEADMNLLIRELRPYADEYCMRPGVREAVSSRFTRMFWWLSRSSLDGSGDSYSNIPEPDRKTVWEVLYNLPRRVLDPYQPLVHLSTLFRNKTVPSIDYYSAKLDLLTSLILENRAKAVTDYDPVSTAFVTFKDPKDARRACKYLAVHPKNPMACLVMMAPGYEDLDWKRVMKSTYRAEFVKDWAVDIGVWGFTLSWVFPVSLFVGLVSIQNISAFWPGLAHYLQHHEWEEELLQSLLPTLLVALLTLLVPLLLLLVAKKAHTILTLSGMHDRILTRYYKFLIVNVLVFFCVGTAALQALLVSFGRSEGNKNVLEIVSNSFPSAGPFYVGWLIFTTGMHGAIELVLFGLPLFVYHSTKHQITPRKRTVGIRPRTFNFYYWIPNHLLVVHVILVFSVLNPLVVAFGWVYFMVESTVVKNQLLHVYAKNYEGNGQFILIRIVRYSLDGLILAQAVFLAYMAVLKNHVNVALTAVLIVITVLVKIFMTRVCRAKYERDDLIEANIVCGITEGGSASPDSQFSVERRGESPMPEGARQRTSWSGRMKNSWRFPARLAFSYASFPHRPHHPPRRQPNPFLQSQASFARLRSLDGSPQSASSVPSAVESKSAEERKEGRQNIHILTSELPPLATSPPPRPAAPALVSAHPPHPAWDDESDVNHPYDNPYYSRPITNALWLPRNPCGLLDLDDTVNVRMSLTTLPSVEPINEWQMAGGSHQAAPVSAIVSPSGAAPSIMTQRRFNGDEDIILPAGIASRVQDLGKDEDVEFAQEHRRPIFRGRRPSAHSARSTIGATPAATPSGLYRPNTIDIGPSHTKKARGASFASVVRPTFASSTTFLPVVRRARTSSADPEFGGLPQADLVPPPPILATHSSRLTAHSSSHRSEPTAVSAREAVVEEVIVEEQEAAEDRLRREEQEARQARQHRSWWTRWLFARVE